MRSPPLPVREDVPLSQLSTLAVGGPARFLADAARTSDLVALLDWAGDAQLPTLPLGDGSNVVVSDAGFAGLVIRSSETTVEWLPADGGALVRAAAGAPWDSLVSEASARGLWGLECLSGIPGRAGAAPIQNIGAYGEEVANVMRAVQVIERATGAVRRLEAADCAFSYRTSRFKTEWRDRFVVTGLELQLQHERTVPLVHEELTRRLGGEARTASDVRREVLAIRRSKSMVFDPQDPNHRSAGSFFVNPVVSLADADATEQAARTQSPMPRYPASAGHTKLSAAWLIERAGFARGYGKGAAGLSSQHTLALINRGGATAADILALAREIRQGVRDRLGVVLTAEPVFIGFDQSMEELLG